MNQMRARIDRHSAMRAVSSDSSVPRLGPAFLPAPGSHAPPLPVPPARPRLPGTVAEKARSGLYRRFGKRALDILLVLVSVPVVMPLLAILMLALWLEGGRPLFPQRRLGQGGRVFTMWKLRTMVVDAEARLQQTLAADPVLRAEWESKQKLRRDPRITPLGQLLRKTSLDELPQFWNVLCGEMSLVGPRPMLPEQRACYPGEAYFRLRPGVTGLWQVSDRNDTTFAARADFDTLYDEILSPGLDLRVMLATATVMARATGH
jgi:exopolysaccharide production protein ExoY